MGRLGTSSRPTIACGVLILAISTWSTTLLAQKRGTYSGTNSEGGAVYITVQKSQDGTLQIGSFQDEAIMYCHGVKIGLYGLYVPGPVVITDRKATVLYYTSSTYASSKLKFEGNTVVGTVTFSSPVFATAKEPPRVACAATTMPVKETFAATN